jgi:hypothetical protein
LFDVLNLTNINPNIIIKNPIKKFLVTAVIEELIAAPVMEKYWKNNIKTPAENKNIPRLFMELIAFFMNR